MSKTTSSTGAENTIEINLKDPRLAAFLAWLVPGLGHMYQGRTGKGILFFVCIVGTFLYGLYIGEGRVVYASTAPVFSWEFLAGQTGRWQYLCQVGVGMPALPALVQRARVNNNKPPLVHDHFMRPPYTIPADGFISPDQTDRKRTVKHPDELAKWNYELVDYFEIGTVFTVIAGLLNILAIYDAYGGPLVPAPEEERKRDDNKSGGDKSDEKNSKDK